MLGRYPGNFLPGSGMLSVAMILCINCQPITHHMFQLKANKISSREWGDSLGLHAGLGVSAPDSPQLFAGWGVFPEMGYLWVQRGLG